MSPDSQQPSDPHDRRAAQAMDSNDVDDAFRAVMEGLRTTLPGVQVLFGFLLILPLQAPFEGLSTTARTAYYVAFFGSAIATILLVAPSAHQRVRAPITGVRRRSERHLRFTVRMTIVGTVVFAISLTAAVFLVTLLVVTPLYAAIGAGVIALLASWSWFYVPLRVFETRA